MFGENGSGKTTVLEGISLISLGRSFKTINAKNYIKRNTQGYNVLGKISKSTEIEVKGSLARKTIQVNKNIIEKISKHITQFPTIVHTPEESVLEGKNNNIRNAAINKHICLYSKKYLQTIQEFQTILKQRNKALKSLQKTEPWDKLLIDYSKTIWKEKEEYENIINKEMEINQAEHKAPKTAIKIKGIIQDVEKIKQKIKESKEVEYKKGYTVVGPHKDVIQYFLEEEEIKTTASQGEKSLFFSILKKAEAQTIKKKSQKEPIILLDDIFSKLDKKNIEKILSLFKKNTQTIITHTDKINTEEINEININD